MTDAPDVTYEIDGALDAVSAVQHVINVLRGGGSFTVEELAASYHHPITGDLSRIKFHVNLANDRDATKWLVSKAIHETRLNGKQVQLIVEDDGTVRLADPTKDVFWRGSKVSRQVDNHAELGDLFNPMSGPLSDGFRASTAIDSKDELRESMAAHGWGKRLPAIVDEHGFVVVGARRLAVAKELGIEPVVEKVVFGDGDAGDAERFRLGYMSNVGRKPFVAADRKKMAVALHLEGLTQVEIAKKLHVSQQTVGRDLEGFTHVDKSESGGSTTKGKRGRGRPRKETLLKRTPELEAEVRRRVEAEEPVSRSALATDFGVGEKAVQLAHEYEIGWQAGRQEGRQEGHTTTVDEDDDDDIQDPVATPPPPTGNADLGPVLLLAHPGMLLDELRKVLALCAPEDPCHAALQTLTERVQAELGANP